MSVSLMLRFTYSATTGAPPSKTQARLDAGAPYTTVSRLWLSYATDDGLDVYHLLQRLALGDELVLQDVDDHTRALRLAIIGGPTDVGDYLDVPVAHVADSGVAFQNNQDMLCVVLDAVEPEPAPPPSPTPGWYPALVALPNASLLVVPPVVEPLTLEEAKLRAGLTWSPGDPRDAQMVGFIRAARERVERDTGIALLTQTRDVYLNHYVTPVDFPAPARPLQSLVERASPDPSLYPWAFRLVVGHPTVAAIPPLLQFAVGLLTAHYATAARDVVVIGTIAQEVPLGYEDAIADYRRVGV